LIPRVCEALFQGIEKCRLNEEQQQQQNTTSMNSSVLLPIKTIYSVQVNYFEIYKEKVHDLLETSTGNATTNKKVREHPQTGPFVEGLISRSVNSYTEIEEQMLAGEKLRTVASTLMNATSSRSHAIFTITFTQTTVDPTSQVAHDKTSKICMIDLAGSERADVSGTSGERLKEGSMINKSLTTLGRVISALSKNSNERVPYRDSILTWLLKESLGGNAKTTMIAMVSPAAENYEETMSTLRYAESAKKVMNRAIINEDCNAKIIRQLREEIVSLRIELAKATRAPSVSISTTITTLPSPVAAADAKRDEMLPGIYASLNEREQALEQLQAKSEKVSENDINTGKKHRLVLDSSFPSLINIKSSIKPNEPLAWTLGQGTNVITYRCPEALQTDDNTDDQYHYICLESQGKVSESDVIKIIYEEKDSLSLEWLNSSVPVSVNGKPLEENLMGVRFAICHRDVLLIGGTMYALRIYSKFAVLNLYMFKYSHY
jgi:kinesin family protein 13